NDARHAGSAPDGLKEKRPLNVAADEDLVQRLNFARSLAGEVGRQIEQFRAEAAPTFERKGLQDFVTAADRRGEETIRHALKTALPGVGVLGVESGGQHGAVGVCVVGAMDRTTDYLHRPGPLAVRLGVM